MEYNQFWQLLKLNGIREKETVSQLEDFIVQFPYCQTSRLLLAKALHDQNSIHFERQLKLAAAYAPDREVLRKLIDAAPGDVEFEFPLRKSEEPEMLVNRSVETAPPMELQAEPQFEEWYTDDEISGRAFEDQQEREKISDPHEIIRKRLSEILSDPQQEKILPKTSDDYESGTNVPPEPRQEEFIEEKKPGSEIILEENIVPEEIVNQERNPVSEKAEESIPKSGSKSGSEETIVAEAAKVKDVLDKMELEHAMEEGILDSLENLPVVAREKKFTGSIRTSSFISTEKNNQTDQSPERSFTQWLKSIAGSGTLPFEEVRAAKQVSTDSTEHTPDEEQDLSDDEIIEKFLRENPKIEPSRAEFYSPVNQAKKSVIYRDDVVSETLAEIYLQQGNNRRARWCYEKLMLLHPEKSAFFAALLKEIPEEGE